MISRRLKRAACLLRLLISPIPGWGKTRLARRICAFGVVFAVMAAAPAVAGTNADHLEFRIRGFQANAKINPQDEYKYQLFDLVLSKTAHSDGSYEIVVGAENPKQSRFPDLLKSGEYSGFITMTSREREAEMRPIRIPVYKGLYGYRIFIIRAKDQSKFSLVGGVSDLQSLWAGQVADWPDYQIIKHNEYNIVSGASYSSMFAMLKQGRFDYFPRGIHEPFKELSRAPGTDALAVETDLMIHYPAPGYIFVGRDNEDLADRLERGFRAALDDGSFDALFASHPTVQDAIRRADPASRRVFRLSNPLLGPETPLDDERLWLRFDGS